jgi:hypothetical protein
VQVQRQPLSAAALQAGDHLRDPQPHIHTNI